MTDWEQRYREGNTPWDKGTPAPELAAALADGLFAGRVLVPGCGMGHDVRAIAMGAAVREVGGLDVAPSAVAGARRLGGVSGVRFEQGDLFALPEGWEGAGFDWVWEHTCFCAIAPAFREAYVEAVWRVLRPGGHLLAIFYLDPGLDPGEEGPPHGVSLAELDLLFGRRFQLEREWAPRGAYPGREGREWVRLLRRREGE
jgi:SAM-dependent methyltransferase